MSEMNEKNLDKYLEKIGMSESARSWIDEIRGRLKMRGIVLIANTESIPICFGVDYTEHDKEIERKYTEQYEETIKELRQNNNLLRCDKELRIGNYRKKNEDLKAKNAELTEKIKAYEEENKKRKEEMAAYENIFYNILQDKCLGEAAEFLPRHLWDKIKIIPQWWLPDELENNETAKEYETHSREIRHLILDYLHGKAAAQVPDTPIKIADWLIDKHMEPIKEMSVSPADLEDMRKLQIDSLRQIAEHLLVFCGRE